MEHRKISLKADEIEAYDEPADICAYDTSSKQSDQLRVWEGQSVHGDPKNSEAYEVEKQEAIILVNNFLTKLYVESQRFISTERNYATDERREQTEDYLTDRVETAHNLITKLRQLLTMEKTDAVMDRSLNRTRFFKTDDDHHSENAEKENGRQKALAEKRRRVQMFGETIDSMVDRYNFVVETINAPGDYKFLDEFSKTNATPLDLKKNGQAKKRKDTKNDGQGVVSSIVGSPLDLLNGRIVDSQVKPTYRIIGTDVTSYKTIYNYSCTLYGLYAEGKGSKKEKAKEDAATEMIRLIVNEQNAKTLSSQLKPFDEQEMNSLQALLKTKLNYTDFLEETNKDDCVRPMTSETQSARRLQA